MYDKFEKQNVITKLSGNMFYITVVGEEEIDVKCVNKTIQHYRIGKNAIMKLEKDCAIDDKRNIKNVTQSWPMMQLSYIPIRNRKLNEEMKGFDEKYFEDKNKEIQMELEKMKPILDRGIERIVLKEKGNSWWYYLLVPIAFLGTACINKCLIKQLFNSLF